MRGCSRRLGSGWVRRASSGGPLKCLNALFLVAVALACLLAGCVVIHTPDPRPIETDNDQRDFPGPLSAAPVNGPTSISKLPDSQNDATTCARPPQVLVDLVSAESTDDTRTPHNNPSDPKLPAGMSGQDSESSDGIHVIPVEIPRSGAEQPECLPDAISGQDSENSDGVRVFPVEAPRLDAEQPEGLPADTSGQNIENSVRAIPDEASQSDPGQREGLRTLDGLLPVTLHLDDVDVRKAIEMLSRQGSVNILVSPGVSGRVTANLENLSFDEAFSAILRLCNLVAHRDKGMIFVYTAEDIPQLDRDFQVFPLDYVAGADVLQTVEGLLSPAGNAFVTESSNTDNRKTLEAIVVEDSPEYLRRVSRYIAAIDRQPRQVLIEAHLLEVVLEGERKHGVNFKHTMRMLDNVANLEATGFANPTAGPAFFVNFDGANLDGLVECLKTTTDAKTLAAPRILVLNGQEARIQMGQRLGYRMVTATETAAVEDIKFLELGVVLTVTPRITSDNRVVMRIQPKVSSGRISPDTGLPEEETTDVETDVSLLDGQGVVIGGLIKEKDSDVQMKVPIVGDLWLIGKLFKHRTRQKQRVEYIIVLLPRVLPYQPTDQIREQVDTERATSPLLYGPLRSCPRPWEPQFPDTLRPRTGCPPGADDWAD